VTVWTVMGEELLGPGGEVAGMLRGRDILSLLAAVTGAMLTD
jgi:hypothetical protein